MFNSKLLNYQRVDQFPTKTRPPILFFWTSMGRMMNQSGPMDCLWVNKKDKQNQRYHDVHLKWDMDDFSTKFAIKGPGPIWAIFDPY